MAAAPTIDALCGGLIADGEHSASAVWAASADGAASADLEQSVLESDRFDFTLRLIDGGGWRGAVRTPTADGRGGVTWEVVLTPL